MQSQPTTTADQQRREQAAVMLRQEQAILAQRTSPEAVAQKLATLDSTREQTERSIDAARQRIGDRER